MSDDTRKTKPPVSEETQTTLAQGNQDTAQTEQPTSDKGENKSEAETANTHQLPDRAKDDTLIKTNQSTTVKIPEMPDIERTVRYGNALLGERANLLVSVRGTDVEPLRIEVENDYVIGRASAESEEVPDLDLTPYNAVGKGVSRRHVIIMKRGDTLHVMDLDSTNGTYLNGVWMYPNQPRVLRDGDELMLGSLVLRFKFILPEQSLDEP